MRIEQIEMLNYLHKSPKWPKSITTFRYVVNTSPPVPQCPAADTGPSLIRWINISRQIAGHRQQILHLNQGFVWFTTSALCSPGLDVPVALHLERLAACYMLAAAPGTDRDYSTARILAGGCSSCAA